MEEATTQTAKTAKSPVKSEPRNFLAAFLLVLGLGGTGANRLYTGDTTIGWVRFALFVGGIVLSPLLIGLPLLWAAQIWGFIDIFVVYHGKHQDADGVKMTETTLDKKAAKILYIIFLVVIALSVLAIIVMLIAGFTIGSLFNDAVNSGAMDTPQDVPTEFEDFDFERYY